VKIRCAVEKITEKCAKNQKSENAIPTDLKNEKAARKRTAPEVTHARKTQGST
jgi:hypothetical protein